MSEQHSTRRTALRFAALVRVSTEGQEKEGESLRTQRTQIEQNVTLLGGTIAGWYGGQEHATPGWEKKEVDRLIADAGKGKYDAVIVAHSDRWSRDNAKSTEGLEAFKKAKVRFFVSVTEYDLYNPEHVLFLSLSAVIGQFQAANQNRKSILNRIARARRGLPTSGKLPFGRTFDKATGQWGIDPDKQALMVAVAKRYLAGEPLAKLAKEYGVKLCNLLVTLRNRCGDQWVLDFDHPGLNIHETVTLTIPRLLSEETIRAVQQRLKANRTYLHKPPLPVHEYLLSGSIFCGGCGYLLTGQALPNRTPNNFRRYYRHPEKLRERKRPCPFDSQMWVRADKIEEQVVRQLFDMFGNPTVIARAIKAAVPDCDEALKRRQRLEAEVAGIGKARDRVLGMIARDVIDDKQAEKQLLDLKGRESVLRDELDKLAATLADIPDEATIRSYVERVEDALGTAVLVYDDNGEVQPGGNDLCSFLDMTGEERRNLIRAVFDSPLADGTPPGVYVSPDGERQKHRPRKWSFTIRGRLEFECVMQHSWGPPSIPHNELPAAPAFLLDGRVA